MKIKEITFKNIKEAILNIELKTIAIILLVIIFIVGLYLVALGLRYKHSERDYYFDTWTGKEVCPK